MTTLEQVIAAAQTLPPADRRNLQLFLQEQERQDAALPAPVEGAPPRHSETLEEQLARYRKAMNWIDEHRAEYLGQWVVLVGDRLISHGFDSRQVDQAAKAAGIEVPFIALVGEEPEAFMTYMVGLP